MKEQPACSWARAFLLRELRRSLEKGEYVDSRLLAYVGLLDASEPAKAAARTPLKGGQGRKRSERA
jgi:hypothetical protein